MIVSNFNSKEFNTLGVSTSKEKSKTAYLKSENSFARNKCSSVTTWQKIIKVAVPVIILISGAILAINYGFSSNLNTQKYPVQKLNGDNDFLLPALNDFSKQKCPIQRESNVFLQTPVDLSDSISQFPVSPLKVQVNEITPLSVDYDRKKIHMIHVAQAHKLPFGMKPSSEYVETVLQSQLQVAQAIRKYPGRPILVEGLYEDATFNPENPFNMAANMIFPQGLQFNDVNELTALQREFLYEYGAVFTLFYLGEISSLYKTIHKEASEIIDHQILSGDFDKIFNAREKETIECVKEAVATQSHDTVLVIFGAAHNFSPLCNNENFYCEVINTHDLQQGMLENTNSERNVLDSSENNKNLNLAVKNEGFELSEQSTDLIKLNERLKEYPGDIASRLNRAAIFTQKNQFSDAKADYEYVIKQYPTNKIAAEKLEKISQLV